MKKYIMLFMLLLPFIGCQSQKTTKDINASAFNEYVRNILTDSTNMWKEYPKPPAVTHDVLQQLSLELIDDSTKYFFGQLSISKMKDHDYRNSLDYFEKNNKLFCVLAMAAHWEPDARVDALKSLSYLIKIGALYKANIQKLQAENNVVLSFLIYLLESTPLFIPGSENATIHSMYISNILWDLDLIANENIVAGKSINEWYKNDLQYETAILKWKSHLVPDK
jgi:hypothetical protein